MASFTETVQFLRETEGLDETAALRAVVDDPTSVERLARPVEAWKARQAEAQAQKEAAAYLRTPAGRRVLARAHQKKMTERAALAEDGRALLVAEGVLTREEAASLTDEEAVFDSGLAEKSREQMSVQERDEADLAAGGGMQAQLHADAVKNWGGYSEEDKAETARDLGVSAAQLTQEADALAAREQKAAYEAVGREPPTSENAGGSA